MDGTQILNKLFGFDSKSMTLKKEMMGGAITFLTMAYILAVNPAILSSTGMDAGAVFTATVVSAIVATVVMAVYAKLPYVLAPGMGLNAFFAYTIVLMMGYSWQFALTAVFVEGLIFIALTLSGVRQKIVEWLPEPLRRTMGPGIGLFLAFLGLNNAGIIVGSESTIVSLGDIHSPSVLLAFLGIILSAILMIRKVPGALLMGIVAITLLGIPMGVTHFTNVMSMPPSLAPVFCQLEWSNILSMDMLVCVITLLFVDMFDTLGTLIGVSQQVGMLDEKGNALRLKEAFMADAIGTTTGALLGTSTVTTFGESATGVSVGGRCGLTALTAAVCFAVAMFFSPLFLAIPAAATAPTLVLVGLMMMSSVTKIDFSNILTALPCFICMTFMTFTCSISDGIMLSVITWVVLHVFYGKWKEMNWGVVVLSILFILKYMFL